MADARMTALRGLSEVFGQGGYSNLVLERLMRNNELSGQERAFCTALFYGVVERRITLDWVLGRYSRQPVEKLSPAVRDILRMAVYQLLYMPSVPESAAVNEAVKETRQMKVASAAGYVNGVLRSFLRDGKKLALPGTPSPPFRYNIRCRRRSSPFGSAATGQPPPPTYWRAAPPPPRCFSGSIP